MKGRTHYLGVGTLIVVGSLVLMALATQPAIPGKLGTLDLTKLRTLLGDEVYAQVGGITIDYGDPLIDDDHVAFMDRGRYPFQDMVCGVDCDGGLVNVVHGNLVYTRQDIAIPGRGLPLEIRFTYNSGSFFDGRYGYGWQLNYNLRYVTNSYNGNVIVVREDDRTDIFVKQLDGTFRSTYGVRDTLEEYAPGRYVLTDPLGVQYWFESPDHHYVTRIQDLNGNALTFTYDTQRALTAVVDDAGRQFTFTYTGDRLTAISDPAGRTFQYAYDTNGDLVQVTDPLGQVTGYAYSAGCHDLLSITDAQGNVRTITYNADYQVEQVATCCGTMALTYDLTGRQTTVTDGNGHATTYRYDEKKRVVAIEDAQAGTTTRTWDDAYNMTSVTDARGNATYYTYDARGNPLTETDALGNPTAYTWHADFDRVISVTDANGQTTTYDYDADGNLDSVTDPLGYVTAYAYDDYGQVTSQTDAREGVTQFEYDEYGNLTKQIDASGAETVYTYDMAGNLLSETDANSHTTNYGYDDLGYLVSITDTLDQVSTYSYDPVGNRISETDANGHTTSYDYDGLGHLVVITDALGCISTYSYDPVGNRISETDANGHTIGYSYDDLNRLVVITDALDYISTYSYDPVGNRISETDANGHTINYSYDPLNRLVVITDALDYISTYSYDPVGNRISETDANGHTIGYSYDPLNRLVVVTDALDYISTYSYDPVGNRISETDANGHTIGYSYDPLNRLVVITDALDYISTYSYDPVGNRISETDANGHTINYSYDPLNRLAVVTDALGYTTTYSYDPVGNLLTRTDANNHQWSYEYDALDRVTLGTSPLGNETGYSYDCVGNRTGRTDPNGAATGYVYDDANRLVIVSYPGGVQVDYQYDGVGNVVQLANTGGLGDVTDRTYDALNRLATETIDYGPFAKTVTYSYDGVGNVLMLTDPDGQTIIYGHDAGDRLVDVTAPSGLMTTMTYDPAGRQTEAHYPHGVWTAYEYDDANRVANITTRDAMNIVILQYDYVYDPAGQVLRVDKNGVQEAEFQYDPARYLTGADYSPIHDYQYSYDPVGNRLTQEEGSDVTSYTYNDEDRVLSQTFPDLSVINYFYDDNANVIQTVSNWGTVDYEYNYENRLTRIDYPPGPWGYIANYYSPEGQRLARDERGQWTYFYPTPLGVVVEMDSMGQTTTRLNPGISLTSGGSDTYAHWDGRSSTSYFTADDGSEAASFNFGYFGEMLGNSGDVDGVDPGLHATDMKVDWDPLLGAELIDVDYAPDIEQRFGGGQCCHHRQKWPGLCDELYRNPRLYNYVCKVLYPIYYPILSRRLAPLLIGGRDPRGLGLPKVVLWILYCCKPQSTPSSIGKQPRFGAAAPPPATGYRRTGTGSVPGPIGPLDCGKISFTVYQRGGQSLIDVVGAPGAVPVRPGPPPYTQVRVDIAWTGTIWIQNTNAQSAFQRRGTPVGQFQQPFFIDVWYRDTVTLGLGGPCRIQ